MKVQNTVPKLVDVKSNLASNLVKYRKAVNLTQAELAERLNYSDKAVSKWERGESVPDLAVLKQLADFYGVKIDTLLDTPKPEPKTYLNISRKRFIISAIAALSVWLIAVIAYAFIEIIFPSFSGKTWLAFIIATPITLMILSILTSVWGNNFWNMMFHSFLTWTTITAIYLILINALISPPATLWLIFLTGLPAQGIIIFRFFYKRIK